MRGLILFTLNSTYIFDDGQVMWVPKDSTREHQLDSAMWAGTWYDVTLKPEEPRHIDNAEFGPVARYHGVTFSFQPSTWGEPVRVHTSCVTTFAFAGEGDNAYGNFRTLTDMVEKAKVALRSGKYGWNVVGGVPMLDTKIAAIRDFREAHGCGLREAKDAIDEAVRQAVVTTSVSFDTDVTPANIDEPYPAF